MRLTKDNVNKLPLVKNKVVVIDDFEIKIRQMTIKQQLELEEILQNKKSNNEIVVPVITYCVVDDNDEPLLDSDMINNLSAAFVAKLFQECIAYNCLDEKELENRAKN